MWVAGGNLSSLTCGSPASPATRDVRTHLLDLAHCEDKIKVTGYFIMEVFIMTVVIFRVALHLPDWAHW